MKRVLVVNDDGYRSAGLVALARHLSASHHVTVVAPASERSWIGKALSAHAEVAMTQLEYDGVDMFVVDGTPADCVQVGIYGLECPRPDMVVSGINIGDNVGRARALSSGTLGAAVEGALAGLPAVAVSLCGTRGRDIDYFSPQAQRHFESAAEVTARTVDRIAEVPLPVSVDLLSVNVPFGATPDAEVQVVAPYSGGYGNLFVPVANGWKHVGAPLVFENLETGTDLHSVANGQIAMTPIDLSLASEVALNRLLKWLDPN